MRRFEKSGRKRDRWQNLLETSYELGYKEGDFLIPLGHETATAKAPSESTEKQDSAAAIPLVNG